jgi:hypothetical protein
MEGTAWKEDQTQRLTELALQPDEVEGSENLTLV